MLSPALLRVPLRFQRKRERQEVEEEAGELNAGRTCAAFPCCRFSVVGCLRASLPCPACTSCQLRANKLIPRCLACSLSLSLSLFPPSLNDKEKEEDGNGEGKVAGGRVTHRCANLPCLALPCLASFSLALQIEGVRQGGNGSEKGSGHRPAMPGLPCAALPWLILSLPLCPARKRERARERERGEGSARWGRRYVILPRLRFSFPMSPE